MGKCVIFNKSAMKKSASFSRFTFANSNCLTLVPKMLPKRPPSRVRIVVEKVLSALIYTLLTCSLFAIFADLVKQSTFGFYLWMVIDWVLQLIKYCIFAPDKAFFYITLLLVFLYVVYKGIGRLVIYYRSFRQNGHFQLYP